MSKNIFKEKKFIISIMLISVLHSTGNTQDSHRRGPYNRLVITNAMVIPGHGGPAYGPADIIIENDRIVQIISYNGLTGRGSKDKIPQGDRVIFGSTVTILNIETDEQVTYRIVGDDEANVKEGKISYQSPIARALISKEIGDVVIVKTPGGDVEYEIDDVVYSAS